ncbi:aminotransferase class III-fold pyridoxal phosphate-dependent enzyme, partial [Mesorhizobium sp.]
MRDINFLTENNAKPIWHPMAHPAEMRASPPKIIMKGEGVSVTDVDGRTVLDAVGGLWNVNLGYSCDPIKKAMTAQLDALPYYSGFRGTSTGPSIELAYELTEWFAPEGMVRTFFTSGGSDSVETALRLARQYWKIRGQGDRTKFLALKKGYHGTHFG